MGNIDDEEGKDSQACFQGAHSKGLPNWDGRASQRQYYTQHARLCKMTLRVQRPTGRSAICFFVRDSSTHRRGKAIFHHGFGFAASCRRNMVELPKPALGAPHISTITHQNSANEAHHIPITSLSYFRAGITKSAIYVNRARICFLLSR